METPDQQQTSQEKNAGSNNRQSASRKRPLQDSYTDQPHLHSPDQIEDNMNLETEIAELKKLVKKQSKKIRSLEKLASKLSGDTSRVSEDIDELYEMVNTISDDVYTEQDIDIGNNNNILSHSQTEEGDESSQSDADYYPGAADENDDIALPAHKAALLKFTKQLKVTLIFITR